MGWRVLVISSRSKLSLKTNALVIRSGEDTKRVFIDELSALIIENPGTVVTAALLELLWQKNITVIFCDNKHNPGAQLIPFYGMRENTSRIRTQLQWNTDTVDKVWVAIAKEKIRKQAQLLEKFNLPGSEQLYALREDVDMRDPRNREGNAARIYFQSLFGSDFLRSSHCACNGALDYGYAIILSAFNREIAAAGYLTQIGIHHCNGANQFNLACDLMEPFRPLVDWEIAQMVFSDPDELIPDEKHQIAKLLVQKTSINDQSTQIIEAIGIYARSIFAALERDDPSLIKFYEYE